MYEDQLARIVDERAAPRLDRLLRGDAPFVFHVLGPPSVGKTFLQKELFARWAGHSPTFLQVSSFVVEREVRLKRALSECADGAYNLVALRGALRDLLNGNTIYVRSYNHLNGTLGLAAEPLKASLLVYLEGPMWLRCLDIVRADFVLLLYPRVITSWKQAYIHRNTHLRNYSVDNAELAFRLALDGWIDSLRRHPPSVDMAIAVDFEPLSFTPNYELTNHRTTEAVTNDSRGCSH